MNTRDSFETFKAVSRRCSEAYNEAFKQAISELRFERSPTADDLANECADIAKSLDAMARELTEEAGDIAQDAPRFDMAEWLLSLAVRCSSLSERLQ